MKRELSKRNAGSRATEMRVVDGVAGPRPALDRGTGIDQAVIDHYIAVAYRMRAAATRRLATRVIRFAGRALARGAGAVRHHIRHTVAYHRTVEELSRLSDDLLKDIGISRGEILYIARRSADADVTQAAPGNRSPEPATRAPGTGDELGEDARAAA